MDGTGESAGQGPVARFGERLRTAFVDLAAASLAQEDRVRLHRRLLAVTNTAKRDLGRAEDALDRFEADLRASSQGGR